MGYSVQDKSKFSGFFSMTKIICFVLFIISAFNCKLHSETRVFTYKGIVYEVRDYYDEGTCSTSYNCCDYASEYTADGNIVIPEEVYDDNDVKYTVTTIGFYSFNGGGLRLKNISLPKTIKTIRDCAFFGCSSLEYLRLPEGLSSIDMQAFMHCSGLKSIDFPQGLVGIGDCAFQYCESLESLDIPDSVTSIGFEAFRDCTSLKYVRLPAGTKEITHGLFAGCTSLQSVEFSESLQLICGWWYPYSMMSDDYPVPGPFYNCTGLRYLKLPDSLEEIDCGAFDGCKGVETIVLPKNLKILKPRAFDFPSLLEVIYPVSDPYELPRNYRADGSPVEEDRFGFLDYIYDIAVLKVGVGGLEKARTTSPWKYFTNIVEVDFSGVEEMAAMSGEGSKDVFRLDGVRVGDTTDGLPSGLYIVRSDGKTSKVMVP